MGDGFQRVCWASGADVVFRWVGPIEEIRTKSLEAIWKGVAMSDWIRRDSGKLSCWWEDVEPEGPPYYIAFDGHAGYRYDAPRGEYFVETASIKYDFHDDPNGAGRGKMLATKDPVGNVTEVEWDTFDLLPIEVTDPLGMKTSATYDYRTFKPTQVKDPNQNRTQVTYSPLGLVMATAVMGKEGENVGDTLADPGTSFEYDFSAFDDSGSPISVTTTQRVYHVNDNEIPTGAEPNETIVSVEYSDGFGRVIQSRAQAEDLDFGDAGLSITSVDDAVGQTATNQRVRVSGWQRYDNKGEVVEKWEPFFSEEFAFEDVSESPEGQSIRMFYDALHRPLRTVQPNGAEERIVYGVPDDLSDPDTFEPTPWEAYTYDANDNGGRTTIEGIDENDFDGHWDTPSSVVMDPLGREIETVQRNHQTDQQKWYTTRIEYDIRGNVLTVTDPLDRIASTKVYDLADRPLRSESIDAGTSVIVFDVSGTPVESRDSRGAWELTVVDDLLRPTHLWGQDSENEDLRLVQHIVYGDDAGLNDPENENLLGKPYIHRDEAGRLEFESYGFKGDLLEKIREVIDPQHVIDAKSISETFRVDWTPDTGESFGDREDQLLDDDHEYRISTTYDALGRAKQVTYPEDVDNQRKVLTPTYNRAGALQSVDLGSTTYVEHIAYNPRGQRILAALGNGVMTRYAYDEKTFQLARLRSEPYTYDEPNETYSPDGAKLQDIDYTYDAVGNVLSTDNSGTGVGVDLDDYGHALGGAWGEFNPDRLLRLFSYDPLYRLTKASGREQNNSQAVPWGDNIPGGTDYNDARPYLESYEYDEVGSLTEKTHQYAKVSSGTESWVKNFGVEANSNRMTSVQLGQDQHSYSYDAGGNLIQENTERFYEWDHAGSMKEFRVDDGSTVSKYGHYSYDAGGQRVLKVNIQGASPVSTIYIDGIFEHHRIHDGTTEEPENNTLHVMDDASRVATHRVGDDIFSTSKPATKYQLGDHLGSSNVLLDGSGALINREEYRPYGETSFGSYAKKRYRFTGKERDEESGLYYHGARYYAPWLSRWTAADPAGMVDGPNLYAYVRGNPVRLVDPDGRESGDVNVDAAVAAASEKLNEATETATAAGEAAAIGQTTGQDVTARAYNTALATRHAQINENRRPLEELEHIFDALHEEDLAQLREVLGDDFGTASVSTFRGASSFSYQPQTDTIIIPEHLYEDLDKFWEWDDDLGRFSGPQEAFFHELGHAVQWAKNLESYEPFLESTLSRPEKIHQIQMLEASFMSNEQYITNYIHREQQAQEFGIRLSDRARYGTEIGQGAAFYARLWMEEPGRMDAYRRLAKMELRHFGRLGQDSVFQAPIKALPLILKPSLSR